jgi:hypothetical protein
MEAKKAAALDEDMANGMNGILLRSLARIPCKIQRRGRFGWNALAPSWAGGFVLYRQGRSPFLDYKYMHDIKIFPDM